MVAFRATLRCGHMLPDLSSPNLFLMERNLVLPQSLLTTPALFSLLYMSRIIILKMKSGTKQTKSLVFPLKVIGRGL